MVAFDAKLTVLQIFALQNFYYVVTGLVLGSFRMILGTELSLSLIFSSQHMSFGSAPGLTGAFATLLSAVVGSVLLVIIVERSKRCLDFTATMFMLHFALTCWFGGVPARWEWYVVQGCAFAVMVLLGEYLCARNEMRDIPLYTPLTVLDGSAAAASAGGGGAAAGAAGGRDIEMGSVRATARDRGGVARTLSPIRERLSPHRDRGSLA